MATLSDDCFEQSGAMITVDAARALIKDRVEVVAAVERVSITHAAHRILAEDVRSSMAVPPHDNSAVDGYALYYDDLSSGTETELPVTGRIAAGHPLGRPARRGEALKILTGAMIPTGGDGDGDDGPDTIVMQEDCTLLQADARGPERVRLPAGIKRGANRRAVGEDIAAGSVILSAGDRLTAPRLGLAASVGTGTLAVRAPLSVALFSTGDEVREPGQPLAPGEIYDTNRHYLRAQLERLGCRVTDFGILADRGPSLTRALEAAARDHHALITSGGVSTGDEDHIRRAVADLGAVHPWRMAIKPGRPVTLGHVGDATFIGLPGNPVAVAVTFMMIGRLVIDRLAGATPREPHRFPVTAGFSMRKKTGRREFVRAHLAPSADGPVARRFARDGAGILSSIVETDGLLDLAEDVAHIEEGDTVPFIPFSELL